MNSVKPPIPDELQRFILLAVPSVPYLEAVLLLRGARQVSWTALQLAKRLYLGEKDAAALLDIMVQSGVAIRQEGYRFSPSSRELAQLLEQLATYHRTHLVEISKLIHSRVDKQAHRFARGFIWKKDD